MACQILGYLSHKDGRKRLVIMFAQFTKRTGCCHDNKVINLAIKNALVKDFCGSGGKTVFVLLAVIGVGRTALVASSRAFV